MFFKHHSLILLALLYSCSSVSESPGAVSPTTRIEQQTPVPGCEKFNVFRDCVISKDINSSIAYSFGHYTANNGSIPYGLEKIKSSTDLERLQNRIQSEGYYNQATIEKGLEVKDYIQYIQDSFEAAQIRSTPTIIKDRRIEFEKQAMAGRIKEQEQRKKSESESLQRDIHAFPYSFEVVCISPSESLLFLSDCSNLEPSVYVYDNGRLTVQFSTQDFVIQEKIRGKMSSNYRLELKSASGNSGNLFYVTIRERTLPGEPFGRTLSTKGKNLNLVPN